MKSLLVSVALGAGFLLSVGAYAEAPAGSTAQCKDGTYYSGTSHKGACKGHDGVKEWLDKTATTPAVKPAAAPAATSTAAATSSKQTTSMKTTAATAAPATVTPAAPSGATAQCKDGTYYSGASHKGACKGHQGVKEWLDGGAGTTGAAPAAAPRATPAAPAAPVTTAPATNAPATTAAAPAAAAPAATAATATHTPPKPASQIEQKAGGGPGMVWVNSASKVYHCQGDEWYGKTKEGSYMSEAAATAAGNHASHGKECGK